MIQIRRSIFETNSSSTHSLSIVAKEDYLKWKKGEVLLDKDENIFVPIDELDKYKKEHKWSDLCTFENYGSGDEVVAFGYFGYDG